jgi:hypothetical protein
MKTNYVFVDLNIGLCYPNILSSTKKSICRFTLLFLFLIFSIFSFSQTVNVENEKYTYSFKIEGVENRGDAKMVWDKIRYYFNSSEEPFKYPLTFNQSNVFEITVPFDKKESEILKYFESQGIVLIELSKHIHE